ncbi:hypothetical protein QP446_09585 [Corynebacterium riegelii]|uniref:hypothetical protein n=1 Tax=Corynebacterium riegelii TaxID=156976 RepID=UPI00254B466E|nr:hypothetical protein [Corynebacterium riegelii]MDK7181003.1 hypothetical protein [Corynebacterium riegelii]
MRNPFPARTLALGAAVASTIALAPAAQADMIDDALAKLPSGPISCDQAKRYWTNEADYNSKVRQAQTVARFDSRGPQILNALARVDEAANRCGLKGSGNAGGGNNAGGGAAQSNQRAPQNNQGQQNNQRAPQNNQGQQGQPQQQAPAPAAPAPAAPAAQNTIVLAPAGAPSFEVPVNGVGTVVLPDVLAMLRQALAAILDFFNVKVPGIN